MGKVMVTGALGNVGHYVATHLLEAGHEVVVTDIDCDSLQRKYGTRAKCVFFDFTKHETFAEALDGVDRVFIMRPPHLGNPTDLKPFVESLAKKGDIRLVAFLSLIGVEKNPFPPHGKIERYITQAGLPYCYLRPSFFMQNISGIHAFEIKHFGRIVVPVGKALTGFIDAEDIGELAAKALAEPEKHARKAYAITGPEAIDYGQVAKILSDELGKPVVYGNPSISFSRNYWIKVRGIPSEQATVMSMLYMMTRMGAAKATTSVFQQVMGKPPRDFRSFVRKNLAAWQ